MGECDVTIKNSCGAFALAAIGAAGFATTAAAGVMCSGGRCKVETPASSARAAQAQSAVVQASPQSVFYSPPLIAPIHTAPFGQTYGRWAAEWWRWALGIPKIKNPMEDASGANCGQRQVGDVWFLAGGGDPIVRRCDVPKGKALFFPLINVTYGASLNESPEFRTEAFARSFARCTRYEKLWAKIDGFEVQKPERYFTGASGSQSPIFFVQMPPGNINGDETLIPELVQIPQAEEGHYLFVWPLKPGKHTIQWKASASGCFLPYYGSAFTQGVTYHLNIK